MRPNTTCSLIPWLALAATACTAPKPSTDILSPNAAQTQLRSYQSRTFDLSDRQLAMRAIIGVLQDLGFIVERANEPLGLVTAARFAEPNFYDVVEVTVTVRPQGESRLLVRINAIYDNRPVEDPEAYQKFFAALERSLFITVSE